MKSEKFHFLQHFLVHLLNFDYFSFDLENFGVINNNIIIGSPDVPTHRLQNP